MQHFKSLTLKDTFPFLDQHLEFTKGTTVVYGLNRTTKHSRNGNAAGKSFLLSQVSEILFDNPVIGERQDKVKIGTRSLSIRINKKNYNFVRKNTKLSVLDSEGNSVGRGAPQTKEWLAKNFPITEDDFYTHVYLDSRRHHPLVMGTSAERKKFLSSFFNLNKLDSERKIIKNALDGLRDSRTAYKELRKEYDSIKSSIEAMKPLSELREKQDLWNSRLDKTRTLAEKSMAKQRAIEFGETAKRQIALVMRKMETQVINQTVFDRIYSEANQCLTNNSLRLKDAQAWALYQQTSKHYTKAFDRLSDKARKTLMFNRTDKVKVDYQTYVESKSSLKGLQDRLEENPKPRKPTLVERPSTDEGKLHADLQSLKHQQQHSKKFGKGKCPTCGQSVKVKDAADLERQIKKLEKRLVEHEEYREYKQELRSYKDDLAVYKKLNTKIEELQEILVNTKQGYLVYKEIRDLPKAPKPFKGEKIETAVMEIMVAEDRELVEALRFLEPNLELFIEYQKLLKNNDLKSSNVMDRLELINSKVAKYTAEISVLNTYRSRKQAMKVRLLELRSALKDETALKLLMEAYGDKAMKRMAIQAISSRLMQQINAYASKIFPENYKFELNWDSTQLNILVHRRYGKRTETSDVRKLSGAESRLFTYVMVLALLAFVPESKRSSLMILDEPATNLSPEMFESLKQLLNILGTVIPTLVIITPNPEERYDNARELTVVKRDGQSSVHEGHPTTIRD